MTIASCRCTSEGTGRFFSRQSARYVKKFRKKGLAKEQRLLFHGITTEPVDGKSILDIGCGVGGLHISLLEKGASSASGVDMSEGMLSAARGLARERGLDGRTRYLQGDVALLADSVPPADIVLLDKVVCCYEDLPGLLDASLRKCREVFALSFPRNHQAFFFRSAMILGRLFRCSFHPYWHDWGAMLDLIRQRGGREIYRGSTLAWSVRVFDVSAAG